MSPSAAPVRNRGKGFRERKSEVNVMLPEVQVALVCINDLSLDSHVYNRLLCYKYGRTAWVGVEETFCDLPPGGLAPS